MTEIKFLKKFQEEMKPRKVRICVENNRQLFMCESFITPYKKRFL